MFHTSLNHVLLPIIHITASLFIIQAETITLIHIFVKRYINNIYIIYIYIYEASIQQVTWTDITTVKGEGLRSIILNNL